MTSEQQYYEAKVFLTAYNDALRTLEYPHKHNSAKWPPIGPPSRSIRPMSDTYFCPIRRERYFCWEVDPY